MLGEAYPEKANADSAPFEIWGLELYPERVDDARLDVVLVKFLRAKCVFLPIQPGARVLIRRRALDVDEAGKMFISTLKWRAEFRAAETVNEQFDGKIFGKLGYVHGNDKEGRPVTCVGRLIWLVVINRVGRYNVYGGDQDLKEIFGDTERFLRQVVL